MHQVDHLPGDGEAEACSLNRVHPAVRLAGEGLIHFRHKFRGHADARIGHAVDQAHGSIAVTSLFPQVHGNPAARLCIFEGVGKQVDKDLIDAQLVRVQVLMLKAVDAEIEVDVLFPYHGLGEVDQVFSAFHDGEGDGAQAQLAAFHL